MNNPFEKHENYCIGFYWFEHEGVREVDDLNEDQILMLSTGIKDKNGKDIFEGDVIELSPGFACEWEKYRATVQWKPTSFRAFRADGCSIHDLGFQDCSFEVIGNIYENPELMQ